MTTCLRSYTNTFTENHSPTFRQWNLDDQVVEGTTLTVGVFDGVGNLWVEQSSSISDCEYSWY